MFWVLPPTSTIPAQANLFLGSKNAVEGAAKFINKTGGIGGRKLVVDFDDTHVNANESRDAAISAKKNLIQVNLDIPGAGWQHDDSEGPGAPVRRAPGPSAFQLQPDARR